MEEEEQVHHGASFLCDAWASYGHCDDARGDAHGDDRGEANVEDEEEEEYHHRDLRREDGIENVEVFPMDQ